MSGRRLSINICVQIIITSGYVALLILPATLFAATPAKTVRLAYSAFAYANPPFWIAHEAQAL